MNVRRILLHSFRVSAGCLLLLFYDVSSASNENVTISTLATTADPTENYSGHPWGEFYLPIGVIVVVLILTAASILFCPRNADGQYETKEKPQFKTDNANNNKQTSPLLSNQVESNEELTETGQSQKSNITEHRSIQNGHIKSNE